MISPSFSRLIGKLCVRHEYPMLTRFTWPSQSALRVVRVSDTYPIAHKYNLPYHSQIVYNGGLSVPIKSEKPRIPPPCKVSNLTSRSLHPCRTLMRVNRSSSS